MIDTFSAVSVNWDVIHHWLFFPLAIAATAFVVWGYRRTVPETGLSWRIILASLRGSALVLLILLLFKPEVVLERRMSRLPELAMLIDQSASMGVTDKSGDRINELKKLLDSERLEKLESACRLRFFHFSDTLREIPRWTVDSLDYTGTSTDIAQALSRVGNIIDSRKGALLLITDGAYNHGENPVRFAERSLAPVFTIGIGDSIPSADLSIEAIKVSPLVYLGDEVPVEVTVTGYEGSSSVLKLISPQGRVIAQEKVSFTAGSLEKRLRMNFTPETAGINTYSLSLGTLEGESSIENNQRHFSVRALESRINVLIAAGAPSSDFAFLKRILERNDNLHLTTLIDRKGGDNYHRGTVIDYHEIDLFIFVDYPADFSDRGLLAQLISHIEGGKPLAVLPGSSFNGRLLRTIADLLPAEFGSSGEEIPVKLAPAADISPLTDFFPLDVDWGGLPPVMQARGQVMFSPSVKAAAATINGEPVIGYATTKGVKVLVLAVRDLWRLSLQDPEHSRSDTLITGFWHNAVRWLSTREEEDLFRVSTGGSVFTSGSRIVIVSRLYDRSYKPLTGAEVTAEISGPEGNLTLDFTPSGEGEYSAETRFFQEGTYRYRVFTIAGSDTMLAEGEFTIEAFNPEFIDPAMRPDLLRSVAEAGGGGFYLPGDFDEFIDRYSPASESYIDSRRIGTFPRWWSLSVIICLLSAEWIIRKRKGML